MPDFLYQIIDPLQGVVAACILIRYKDERKDGQFRSEAVYALYG